MICSSFLSIKWRTPRWQRCFETVLDLDRVFLQTEVIGTHTRAFYRIEIIDIYTLVCSREMENLDCTFAELALHPNRPLKDQPTVFPILSKSSYSSIYSTRIHSASECKNIFNTCIIKTFKTRWKVCSLSAISFCRLSCVLLLKYKRCEVNYLITNALKYEICNWSMEGSWL